MVAIQVYGLDAAIAFAASQGNFQLNVYKPLIALNCLDSLRLLTDSMHSFDRHCIAGLSVHAERIELALHFDEHAPRAVHFLEQRRNDQHADGARDLAQFGGDEVGVPGAISPARITWGGSAISRSRGMPRRGRRCGSGRRRTPGRPVTFGTTDAFLEHYGLASLADLPGAAEMKASGLLAMDLPSGFAPPQPTSELGEDEDPLGAYDAPEFAQDFLGEQER